jgi:hypothetical protein
MPRRQRPFLRREGKDLVHDGNGVTPPPPPSPPPPPPLPMPDMAQFWAYAGEFMMGFMMSWMAAMPRQGKRHETIGNTLTSTIHLCLMEVLNLRQ